MSEQNLIKVSEVVTDYSNITITKYIPFLIKQNIVKNILLTCISVEEDGFKRVDSAMKRMAIEFSICNQISNIDMSDDDSLETYDSLKESGAIEYILDNFDYNEIKFITDCVNEEIEEMYKVDNSIEGIISKGLDKLLTKIPDNKGMTKFINNISKQFDKLDPSKLKIVKEVMAWDKGDNK